MENQEFENVFEYQTDVTIGEDVFESQSDTEKTQTIENEILNNKQNQERKMDFFEEADEDIEKPIGVYAKYDENGNIKEVNSDIFIDDLTGWTKIDEGFGDRYAHAQSQYFEQDIDN